MSTPAAKKIRDAAKALRRSRQNTAARTASMAHKHSGNRAHRRARRATP